MAWKPETLMTRPVDGAILTRPSADAQTLAARMRVYFSDGAKVPTIQAVPCKAIDGTHDWYEFRLHRSLHERARVYIAAYEQGGRDRLDVHYGRPLEAVS